MKKRIEPREISYNVIGWQADLLRAVEVDDRKALKEHTANAAAVAAFNARQDLAEQLRQVRDAASDELLSAWENIDATPDTVQAKAELLARADRGVAASETYSGGNPFDSRTMSAPKFVTKAHAALAAGVSARSLHVSQWSILWEARAVGGEQAPLTEPELQELAEPIIDARDIVARADGPYQETDVLYPERVRAARSVLDYVKGLNAA